MLCRDLGLDPIGVRYRDCLSLRREIKDLATGPVKLGSVSLAASCHSSRFTQPGGARQPKPGQAGRLCQQSQRGWLSLLPVHMAPGTSHPPRFFVRYFDLPPDRSRPLPSRTLPQGAAAASLVTNHPQRRAVVGASSSRPCPYMMHNQVLVHHPVSGANGLRLTSACCPVPPVLAPHWESQVSVSNVTGSPSSASLFPPMCVFLAAEQSGAGAGRDLKRCILLSWPGTSPIGATAVGIGRVIISSCSAHLRCVVCYPRALAAGRRWTSKLKVCTIYFASIPAPTV